MRDRFNDPEYRFRLIRIAIILLVVFGLFNTETMYYLDLFWKVFLNLLKNQPALFEIELNLREFGNNAFKLLLGGLVYFAFLHLSVFFNAHYFY